MGIRIKLVCWYATPYIRGQGYHTAGQMLSLDRCIVNLGVCHMVKIHVFSTFFFGKLLDLFAWLYISMADPLHIRRFSCQTPLASKLTSLAGLQTQLAGSK